MTKDILQWAFIIGSFGAFAGVGFYFAAKERKAREAKEAATSASSHKHA